MKTLGIYTLKVPDIYWYLHRKEIANFPYKYLQVHFSFMIKEKLRKKIDDRKLLLHYSGKRTWQKYKSQP